MGRTIEAKPEDSKESFQVGDIWKDRWGTTWYSENIISKIINLCRRTKEAREDDYVKNLLADDILKILDFKDSKGD